MRVYYEVDKFNKDNQLVRKGRRMRSRSFVKQFLQLFYCKYTGLNYTGIVSVANSTTSNYLTDSVCCPFYINARSSPAEYPAGYYYSSGYLTPTIVCPSDYVGIVAGSGTAAVTVSDYALTTRIANGTAASQLEYLGTEFTTVTASDPNASFTVSRTFRNSSGGNITINEVGIYAVWQVSFDFCIVRDKLGSAYTINDGEYMKITYTFQVSV
jgi:hypothetical protein